jgi:hypothetical protein
MTAIEQYPDTAGVPEELFQKRMEGESYEDYKERLRDGQKVVDEYLATDVGQAVRPSLRILKRIKQGKRNVHALSAQERNHIQNILGFIQFNQTGRKWENELKRFTEEAEEIESTEFLKSIRERAERLLDRTSATEQEPDEELQKIQAHVESNSN